jgi:hypothetical protein
VGEITVLGNRGERGWQGNDPNPTKGWRPVRDANGNLTGWERKNSQTGQKERKSVQWGEQNGLTDPGNKFELVDPGFQTTVPSTQTKKRIGETKAARDESNFCSVPLLPELQPGYVTRPPYCRSVWDGVAALNAWLPTLG